MKFKWGRGKEQTSGISKEEKNGLKQICKIIVDETFLVLKTNTQLYIKDAKRITQIKLK